ncbi:WcaI family glycosyltransferase [Pontixanthobacter gangjinensis]|uniref:WcaI family glycosyltransferase n=1 Tax=Pontixanthobacter gangjinensis TaxID=1028742 RepID=UPI0019274FE2|nr:WcaI family glycosyltransferase [Pontixanthobacter gangjinensis]
MQILILGLNYEPEPIGIGPYTAGLAQYLAARGHEVTVIAGNPYYPDWRLAEGANPAGSSETKNGVKIIRVPHYIPSRPSGVKRILHYLSFARNARSAAKNSGPADIVVAIAPALLSAPVALRVAQQRRAVSWLHIQDFEVEAAIATGLLSRGPIASLAKRFERWVLSSFDHVSSVSPMMALKAKRKGADANRTVELRNWADESVKPSLSRHETLRAELSLPAGIIALYSGNLALKQGCGLLGEAAKVLAEEPGLHIVVCGAGPARKILEEAACNLPNLHVRDLMPRERLNDLLGMADIHLLPQIEGAADLVLPSKLANMLASGRPVVATAKAGTGLAQEVEGCGIITPPGNAHHFAQAIKLLAKDAGMRATLGDAAAKRAHERWTSTVLLERFALALEHAVSMPEEV